MSAIHPNLKPAGSQKREAEVQLTSSATKKITIAARDSDDEKPTEMSSTPSAPSATDDEDRLPANATKEEKTVSKG